MVGTIFFIWTKLSIFFSLLRMGVSYTRLELPFVYFFITNEGIPGRTTTGILFSTHDLDYFLHMNKSVHIFFLITHGCFLYKIRTPTFLFFHYNWGYSGKNYNGYIVFHSWLGLFPSYEQDCPYFFPYYGWMFLVQDQNSHSFIFSLQMRVF